MSKPAARVIFVLLCIVPAAAYGLIWLRTGAPLDDAYIYSQYARQASQGLWFRYQAGDPVSTGATSLLYTAILSVFHLLPLKISGLHLLTWAFGTACLILSLVSVMDLCRTAFRNVSPLFAAALFVSCGPWLASFYNGLETGLFSCLFLLLLADSAKGEPKKRILLWLLLVIWVRPEGQAAAVIFSAWLAMRLKAGHKEWRWIALPAAAAVLPSLLVLALTGSTYPDSLRPKSLAVMGAQAFPLHIKETLWFLWTSFKGIFLGLATTKDAVGYLGDAASGNSPALHLPPFALVFGALGLLSWKRTAAAGSWKSLWLPLCAWFLLTWLLVAWYLPVAWHHHRYLVTLYPAVLLGLLLFLDTLPRAKAPAFPALHRFLGPGLMIFWLAFGLASSAAFYSSTAMSARNYAEAHGRMALKLAELKPGTRVAVADAGILAYFSGQPITDLLGITDHEIALAAPHGKGALLETLFKRPLGRRPEYAALHLERQDISPRAFLQAWLLKEVSVDFHEPTQTHMGLYQWAWGDFGPWSEAYLPWKTHMSIEDDLNIADLASEKLHGYSGGEGTGQTLLANFGNGKTRSIPEGGRWITSQETFSMHPWALHSEEYLLWCRIKIDKPGVFKAVFNGQAVDKAIAPLQANRYLEFFLTVPGWVEPGEGPGIETTVSFQPDPPTDKNRGYASYHYWLTCGNTSGISRK